MIGKKSILAAIGALVSTSSSLHAAVSPAPERIFGLPLTNSIITSWVIAIALIVAIRLAVGRPQLVPSKGQAVVESLVVGLRDMVEPIIGRRAIGEALPFVLAFFVYILVQNLSGLFPGVGSIGWGYEDAEGTFHVTRPLIRPGSADWNGTIALAVVAMAAWLLICLRHAGLKAILFDIFGNKAERKEVGAGVYAVLTLIFLVVGVIELISIAIRPVTLSVRLFGNIYGGENLLHETNFFPAFYFLELLVGCVQALVFILLFSVYIGLICNHDDGHEEGAGAH